MEDFQLSINELKKAKASEVETLTMISKLSFNSDVEVGGEPNDGPPDYDNVDWHLMMQKNGFLYSFYHNNELVGGAVLFIKDTYLYIGRIFIHPNHFRKGYGIKLMELIEQINPNIKRFILDTPIWNIRTNNLYLKCGYHKTKEEIDQVTYEKII